jgi:hypothetical protein
VATAAVVAQLAHSRERSGLCLFLALLARFVWRRTESAFLAIAAAVVFCSFTGLYNERNGMGVPWPDYQSMFFLSSAALSIGLYSVERKIGWLALVGASVTMAALARDTGSVYSAVVIVPILVVLLVIELWNGLRPPGVLARVAACAIPGLPAIVLLAGKISWFNHYYMSSNGTTLRKPLVEAIQSTWYLFSSFTGYVALVGWDFCSSPLSVLWPRRRWASADVVVVGWPLLFLAFLLVNGYTSDLTKEVMYMAPGLVCVAATLAGGINMRSRPAFTLVSVVLVMCLAGAGWSGVQAYERASHPTDKALSLRNDQRAVAEAIASIPQRVVWQSYSAYDWATPIEALTFYDFGHYQPADNRWFHNRKNYWDANFPNMELPQLQAYVLAEAAKQVDLVIVLAHPEQKPGDMEDYSFSIASYVAAHVQSDSGWTHYRDVDTSVSGPLSLYLNARRTGLASRP